MKNKTTIAAAIAVQTDIEVVDSIEEATGPPVTAPLHKIVKYGNSVPELVDEANRYEWNGSNYTLGQLVGKAEGKRNVDGKCCIVMGGGKKTFGVTPSQFARLDLKDLSPAEEGEMNESTSLPASFGLTWVVVQASNSRKQKQLEANAIKQGLRFHSVDYQREIARKGVTVFAFLFELHSMAQRFQKSVSAGSEVVATDGGTVSYKIPIPKLTEPSVLESQGNLNEGALPPFHFSYETVWVTMYATKAARAAELERKIFGTAKTSEYIGSEANYQKNDVLATAFIFTSTKGAQTFQKSLESKTAKDSDVAVTKGKRIEIKLSVPKLRGLDIKGTNEATDILVQPTSEELRREYRSRFAEVDGVAVKIESDGEQAVLKNSEGKTLLELSWEDLHDAAQESKKVEVDGKQLTLEVPKRFRRGAAHKIKRPVDVGPGSLDKDLPESLDERKASPLDNDYKKAVLALSKLQHKLTKEGYALLSAIGIDSKLTATHMKKAKLDGPAFKDAISDLQKNTVLSLAGKTVLPEITKMFKAIRAAKTEAEQ